MNNAELKDISSSSSSSKPNIKQEYSNETINTLTFLQGNIIDEKYAGSFAQLNGRPLVLLIIFSIIAHYVFITWKKVPISSYGLSYKTAFKKGQFWRVFTALIGHDDILHLLFDMFILWSASALELRVGSLRFLRYTMLLVLLNTLIFYLIYDLIVRRCGLGSFFGNHYTAGLTPVVLGQIIILSNYQRLFDIPLFPGLLLPLAPAPIVLVFIASMVIARSKFFQHTFGVFVGMVIIADYFTWVNNYWLFTTMTWVFVFLIASVKKTTDISIPWLEVHEWPFEDNINVNRRREEEEDDEENIDGIANDNNDHESDEEEEDAIHNNRSINQVIDLTEDETPRRQMSRFQSILNFRRARLRNRGQQPGTILPS